MSKSILLASLGKKAAKKLLENSSKTNLNTALPVNSVLAQQKRYLKSDCV